MGSDKKAVRQRASTRPGRRRQQVARRQLTYFGLLAAAVTLEALRRYYADE